jgi:hypothetical protein
MTVYSVLWFKFRSGYGHCFKRSLIANTTATFLHSGQNALLRQNIFLDFMPLLFLNSCISQFWNFTSIWNQLHGFWILSPAWMKIFGNGVRCYQHEYTHTHKCTLKMSSFSTLTVLNLSIRLRIFGYFCYEHLSFFISVTESKVHAVCWQLEPHGNFIHRNHNYHRSIQTRKAFVSKLHSAQKRLKQEAGVCWKCHKNCDNLQNIFRKLNIFISKLFAEIKVLHLHICFCGCLL